MDLVHHSSFLSILNSIPVHDRLFMDPAGRSFRWNGKMALYSLGLRGGGTTGWKRELAALVAPPRHSFSN